jgi:hypothetical protein
MDNILYLAVLFFCQGTDCHVITIDDPYQNKAACERKINEGERLIRQNFPNLSIVEPYCLDFRYGIHIKAHNLTGA